ncbi:Iron-sulfur cluster insertion protein ErpA [Geodia barretti]|uniref:Iron-sulfur cluster assembly 1 homolog, mitochondrial n=1 Tax=Geodia barretti TaxID=519541 RepID=A0AA35T468_GEOBA|nr:Iron-sulfur cluster insertion protein ErpA [Geodia barretti]
MPITRDGVELTVEISEKAAEKIKYFAQKDGTEDNVGVRVAVKGGGCSGLTYDLKISGEHNDTDKVVEQYGVKVIVDKKSYIYLVGTQLDFSDGLNGKGFVFENPNAKKACGCGTSFSV